MNSYEFFNVLKDNDYKFTSEELKKFANSIKHGNCYYKQKIENITDKVIKLGYFDFETVHDYDDFFHVVLYAKNCDLEFNIYFHDGECVKIIGENYNYDDENITNAKRIKHDRYVGNLSVGTFARIVDLFVKHGKYADVNNPDIVTLLDSQKNIKSARTIL